MDGKADGADINIRALIFALLALACGHMLSTLLRTIPAVSLDVMAADFRTRAADAGEPHLDLSFRLRCLADSGRRRDGSLRRPSGFPEPAGGHHRRRAGVGTGDGAGEFSVRAVPARRRHVGHADVPDDAGRQADVGGALRPVVRRSSCRSAISACCCRRVRWPLSSNTGDGGRGSGSPPVSARSWRSPCSLLVPKQPAEHADQSSPLSQMAEVLRIGLSRSVARPDRAVAGVARGLAGAAGIVGRAVADGDQGAQPHRGGQCARPVHARVDRGSRADGDSRSRHRPSARSAGRHAFICRVVAGR